MPLDLDPVYHTETMVKILREQGSPQLAMELAESILQKQPDHAGVQAVLEELKVEARQAFERFKNSGRPAGDVVSSPSEESEDSSAPSEEVSAESPIPDEISAEAAERLEIEEDLAPRLSLVPALVRLPSFRERKIERLKALLCRIELNRRHVDASAT
ncbi:MAG TPA: hypothetical protein DF383_07665 [Deltaproteobacteria bacterium]|nr:hypothetical protein [Deltaproteobacteria bacterium]